MPVDELPIKYIVHCPLWNSCFKPYIKHFVDSERPELYRVSKKSQHLIKWYLSVDIYVYAIVSIS